MKVKGLALVPITHFIKERFGEDAYKKWLESLSPEAKETYSGIILPITEYPLVKMFSEPMEAMCKMFFTGSHDGAVELGKYSADYSLNGVYKFFLKFGSAAFITKKASTILPSYYVPSKMEVVEADENHGIVRITQFEEISEVIEYRILGWMIRAIELSGMTVNITIQKSLAKGDPFTEYLGNWSKK